MSMVFYEKNEVILEDSNLGSNFYVIAKGTVEFSKAIISDGSNLTQKVSLMLLLQYMVQTQILIFLLPIFRRES